MTISVEHFRPDPIILISYLTTEDTIGDEHRAAIAIQNYKRRMGGRVIAIWDTTLIATPLNLRTTPAPLTPDGLTTIIVDGGEHPAPHLDDTLHTVTTREQAVNVAYAILRYEYSGGHSFFAAH